MGVYLAASMLSIEKDCVCVCVRLNSQHLLSQERFYGCLSGSQDVLALLFSHLKARAQCAHPKRCRSLPVNLLFFLFFVIAVASQDCLAR